jgi:hypothetical protein
MNTWVLFVALGVAWLAVKIYLRIIAREKQRREGEISLRYARQLQEALIEENRARLERGERPGEP